MKNHNQFEMIITDNMRHWHVFFLFFEKVKTFRKFSSPFQKQKHLKKVNTY